MSISYLYDELLMKIGCKCGAVIYDQTDYLSYKAHFVADRDWEDFLESAQSPGKLDQSYVRACYQCVECGRLYVDDPGRNLKTFLPEEDVKGVLNSSKGPKWRAPLIAIWEDKPFAGEPKGGIWCEVEEGINAHYENWEEMERAYYALFHNMKARHLLRSSFLRKNTKQLHVWPSDGGQ